MKGSLKRMAAVCYGEPARPLGYCSNVHPVDDWLALRRELALHVPRLAAELAPGRPFPLGLWLSRAMVEQCRAEGPERFRAWCEEQGCCVLALNGFPHGGFHGGAVKEQAYLPDWRSEQRAEYTLRLAELLAGWLPEGGRGSISTVPIGWRPLVADGELPLVRRRLRRVLEELDRLRQTSGKELLLALEPEPGCVLQTTEQLVAFCESLQLPASLQPLLGICYDACHQAVLFEEPAASLQRLAEAGIPLARVQASSALRYRGSRPDRQLAAFVEGRYLHQTVRRRGDGTFASYADLPEALAAWQRELGGGGSRAEEEWRIHFHVPVFLDEIDEATGTTRPFLVELLQQLPPEVMVEVETYTWDVLPAGLRGRPLLESLLDELRSCKAALDLARENP